MQRFHTGQVNPEEPSGDWLVVERGVQGVHYHPLSHVHLLAFDQVEYGTRGFVGLQTHVYGVKHLKGNENGIFYIYVCVCVLVQHVITVRASSSAKDEGPPSVPETEEARLREQVMVRWCCCSRSCSR